jgi:3D (Asp-Asp-Asp) domain-containing protein
MGRQRLDITRSLASVLALGLALSGAGMSVHAHRTRPADHAPPVDRVCRPPAPPPRQEKVCYTLPLSGGDTLAFRSVVVTGYTSSPHETDSTPFLTASMTRVRSGCLALSRDLLRSFTPGAPFDFGDWVVIPGVGLFIVEDTMNERWTNRADIWFADRREALRWGRRVAWIAPVPAPVEAGGSFLALGPRSELLQ